MDSQKVSFGFAKTDKKSNLLRNNKIKSTSHNIELIKCLEGKQIKLINEKVDNLPLVIPIKECQKTSNALASLLKRRAVLLDEDEPNVKQSKDDVKEIMSGVTEFTTEENLDKRAARELLSESKSKFNVQENKNILQIITANDLPLDGAKESTIEDYESVPVQQFGFALLRGMGWKDPPKKDDNKPADDTPFVRPKGMGLGADKALKVKPLLVEPEKNEILVIKKQAYVRILGGKYKDMYGQIEGFDDHAGRVIVKLAIGGTKEAFNEFLCQPVSKKEYAEYGKCINTAKYERYKTLESEQEQLELKKKTQDDDVNYKTKLNNIYKKIDAKEHKKEYNDDREVMKSYKTERHSGHIDNKMHHKPSSSKKSCTYEESMHSKNTHSFEKNRREYKQRYKSRSPKRNTHYYDISNSNQEIRCNEHKMSSDTSPERSRYNKKCKQKKNKAKSKSRKRDRYSSSTTTDSGNERSKKFHKKSKKSKKERHSRSRSRCRS
ncbi:G-patch domain and KOW motifs-containing protein [Teleopsis dalmanni]|uniref:G-patch domain and KOW motifs-containing protein n=1 Tax=Teleopsis dalmanni TaxID=139649 RepID=UPI0018CF1074|nr:G-patch domain and KOW motifs-containing protein [Teleopsis dalmanni]